MSAPSAALRQLLLLNAEDRNVLLTLIPTELAVSLIEEAPVQAATVQKLEDVILTRARDLRRQASAAK